MLRHGVYPRLCVFVAGCWVGVECKSLGSVLCECVILDPAGLL